MSNQNSEPANEGSLTPQEDHLSVEANKETGKAFKGNIFKSHPLLFRRALLLVIFASSIIVLWLVYPKLFAFIKNILPEGYSIVAIVLGIVLFVFSLWAMWFIPRWQVAHIKTLKESLNEEGKPTQTLADPGPDERFSLENEARKTLAQIIGGMFVLLGLFFTAENVRITQENAEKTRSLADRGQVTERFTKAITQLGDEQLAVRLGGIYALEKIAKDYPDDYHWTVMEVLTGFVRANAPNKNVLPSTQQNVIDESLTGSQINSKSQTAGNDTQIEIPPLPPTDIQAAMTVIGRRSRTFGDGEDQRLSLFDTNLHRITLYRANLSGADLRGTDLTMANLREVDLRKAVLSGTVLIRADLREAVLIGADLRGVILRKKYPTGANIKKTDLSGIDLIVAYGGAYLAGVNFSGANLSRVDFSWVSLAGVNLSGANLTRADLTKSNLSGADLRGTDLSGANLSGANLSNVKSLTWQQIDSAMIDTGTILPPEFFAQQKEKLKSQKIETQ